MKSSYFLFLFLSNFCYSQNHIIIDSITNKPVPYANIKLVKADKGFYSDGQGKVTINEHKNDSIQISCLGYITIFEKINFLKDTIFLVPKIQNLKEVIIHPTPPILKKVGFKRKSMNFYTGVNLQLGMLLKPIKKHENVYIQKVLIPIKKTVFRQKNSKNFNSVFKVSLFSNKNNLPYESLLDAPLIINCHQDSEKIISIDVSKEYIKFDSNGIFICVELVGEIDSKGTVIKLKNPRPGFTFTDKMTKDFSTSQLFFKGKLTNEWKVLNAEKIHSEKDIYLAFQLILEIYED